MRRITVTSFTRLFGTSVPQAGHIPVEAINKLPKAELHLHLDGSIRAATLLDLMKQQNDKIPHFDTLPTLEQYAPLITPGNNTKSLKEFLKAFDYTLIPLQNTAALSRGLWEIAEDCKKDNVRYVEVRFCPQLHTMKGSTSDEILQGVLDTCKKINQYGDKNYPVMKIIVTAVRNLGVPHSIEMAELAARHFERETNESGSRELVGFDIAGSEAEYPTHLFRDALKIVKDAQIPITIHAGEAAGPESVRSAIEFGAQRIGHGVALQHDKELVSIVRDRQIAIEICQTSNIVTKACADVRNHPLPLYLKNHIPCIPCTDSTSVILTTVSQEYSLAQSELGADYEQLFQFCKNGIIHGFLDAPSKEKLLQRVEKEAAQILADYGI